MENKPHYQLYIDGDWVSGSTQQSMDSQNPATGETWATFDCASKNDVNRAVSCLLYTSPSPRDATLSRMPSSA